jgi:hypothetical protein
MIIVPNNLPKPAPKPLDVIRAGKTAARILRARVETNTFNPADFPHFMERIQAGLAAAVAMVEDAEREPTKPARVARREPFSVIDGGAVVMKALSAPWYPSAPQLAELAKLKAAGALSPETAVGPRAYSSRHIALNAVIVGTALVPKGLVARVVVPANYGEPKRSDYWITPDGLKVLERGPAPIQGMSGTVVIDEFAYDGAADAAEQLL